MIVLVIIQIVILILLSFTVACQLSYRDNLRRYRRWNDQDHDAIYARLEVLEEREL